MPSDPRVTSALAALARPISEFRSMVRNALASAEALRSAQSAAPADRAARARAELGAFGAEHIDPARFASLFPEAPAITRDAASALGLALAVLRDFTDRGDDAYVVTVPPGVDFTAAIHEALGAIGRVFGAATLAENVRAGRYRSEDADELLRARDFRAWNRAVRRGAPPLIVAVRGADLHAASLGELADGGEKFVVVVDGPSAPAPLARCITPGTLVMQTVDGSGLDRVANFDGPAIAAIVPPGSAIFQHDPAAGKEPWQRLTVETLGEKAARRIGGVSPWQMTEDQLLLADLARTPFAIPASGKAAAPAMGASDAVDRIAAWLLDQSGLRPS